jgi:hypothetical protein
MSDTLISGFFGIATALITVFGTIIVAVIQKDKWNIPTAVWISIGGILGTLGCVIGAFVGFSIASNGVMEQSSFENNPSISAPSNQSSLVINGASYSIPNPSSSPYCVAQEVHTNGSNIVDYEINVPNGWVMMWSSWKATWNGGSYNQDGLLIIEGPYRGTIQINTGGSCSGPIEWYDFIHQNRISDFPVPSRPEYKIP